MLDCLHSGRVGEFRRVLRACAIAVTQGRQALVLSVPPEQGPDAFARAFHAHCREKGGRPVRLLSLDPAGGRTALQRLAAQVGLDEPWTPADAPLRDLLGTRDRWFDRLRAALAADLATDGVAAGPGVLVVDGDATREPTLLAFLAYLCPRQAPWRALPSLRPAAGQFLIVATCPADATLPEGIETLAVRPFDGEDLRAVADVAARMLLAPRPSARPGARARGADGSPAALLREAAAAPLDPGTFGRGVAAAIEAGALLEAATLADAHPDADPDARARAFAAAGRGEDALQAARRVDPLDAAGCIDAGLLAVALGHADQARALADAAGTPTEPALRAALAGLRAEILSAAGDFAAAEAEARHALDLGPAPAARAALANAVGGARFRAGDHDEAGRWFRLAAELSPDRSRETARALHNQGLLELRAGRPAGAVARLQESVILADDLGEAFGAALARRSLAIALEHLGRYGAALEYAVESLDRLARLGREADVAAALLTVADLLATFGEWDRSLALVAAAETRAAAAHLPVVAARCAFRRADCRWMREDPGAAAALAAAHEGLVDCGQREQAVFCAARAAEASLAEGDDGAAGDWAARVLDLHRVGPDEATGRALLVRARRALAAGSPAQAMADLGAARDVLHASGQREPLAEALRSLAEATAALGDPEAAVPLADEARALIEDLAASVPAPHQNAFLARPSIARITGARTAEVPRVPDAGQPVVLAARPRLRRLLPSIVGESAGLHRVLVALERVRDVSMPVLLLGESGTGKELFAEALHRLSPRADGPFVRVNAAAFTDTLLLSELFGHERGAFTGAHARAIGKFEAAHGGTLFLDEIGDVSERLQTALLRVIEEQRFQRVGGTETVRVDVRLVFATNRDLDALRRDGRFREDLFHRISGLSVPVPPLRERAEDIPALTACFVDELSRETGRPFEIAGDALELLSAWRWPGNVRELRNVVRKTALMGDGPVLTREALVREHPALARATGRRHPGGTDPFDLVFGRGLSLFDARREVEVALIREALARTGGNISAAAQLLGMKRPRLSQMVKEYDLKVLPAGTAREAVQ